MHEPNEPPHNLARLLARCALGHGVGCCFDTGYSRAQMQHMALKVFDTLSILRCTYGSSSAVMNVLHKEPPKDEPSTQLATSLMMEMEELEQRLFNNAEQSFKDEQAPAPEPTKPLSALQQGQLERLEGDRRKLRMATEMLASLAQTARSLEVPTGDAHRYYSLVHVALTACTVASGILDRQLDGAGMGQEEPHGKPRNHL